MELRLSTKSKMVSPPILTLLKTPLLSEMIAAIAMVARPKIMVDFRRGLPMVSESHADRPSNKEMLLVTLLTIAAIFFIVALTFRSLILSAILVMTVMSGVFVNVVVSGFGGGSILYIAYLIVQSILMGAAIDYGILFANYYRENRAVVGVEESLKRSYKCSIHTILTSGLILILVPAIMTILVSDPTISDIVKSISIGASATVTLILFVLPGVLALCDKVIVRKRNRVDE